MLLLGRWDDDLGAADESGAAAAAAAAPLGRGYEVLSLLALEFGRDAEARCEVS